MGRKKRPFYRIVAADSRSPRDGRNIEVLGYYNPMTEPADLRVDLDRVDYWLGVGASPSDTVGHLIQRARAGSAAAE
jgi:small subunit ribosomal protein S16